MKQTLKAKTSLNLISAAVALSLLPSSLALAEEAKDDSPEVIIVKGTKIERTLSETVDSVSIYDESDFEQQPVFDFEDLYTVAPNVYGISDGEGFAIRGITQNSLATGSGNGALGSLYLDGIALVNFGSRFGPVDLWDVQQVGIFKGPQSSNVGRSALAGAVVVTTNRPEIGFHDYALRLGYGTANSMNYAGMANVSTGERSALRFTYEGLSSDGFITNTFLNKDDFDARDNQTFRAKWLFEPTENLKILTSYQSTKTERGQNWFMVPAGGSLENRESTANIIAREDYEADLFALNIDYTINKNWAMLSITSFLDAQYDRYEDDDFSSAGGQAYRGRKADDESLSQELRFNFNSDNLKGVFGVYYLDIDYQNTTLGLTAIRPASVGVPNALLPFYPDVINVDLNFPFDGRTKNSAFFTEWVYDVNDSWSVFAGLRYDREKQSNISETRNSLNDPNALPDPVAAGQAVGGGALGARVTAGITQVNSILRRQLEPKKAITQTSYDALLPQVGFTYHFSDNDTLSFFVKRGYRSGGAELDSVGNLNEYDPEFITNYEVALRSTLIDNTLFLNSNVFMSDWTDQQITIFRNNNVYDSIIQNAGESELKGIELSLDYRPTEQLSTFFNIGYSNSKFTKFISNEGDFSGNRFALSPKLTAATGATYDFNNNWFLSGNVSYHGSSFANIQNTIPLESRTLVNLKLGYQADNYDINLYVKNLTDKTYKIAEGRVQRAPNPIVKLGAPREFGIVFNYKFAD